jgi:ketosteroid isomerase-like protein
MDETAVVRTIHDRWASGDYAADLLHPDIEWYMPHPGGQVRGREEVVAFLRSFMGAWEEHEVEVEEIRPIGDGRVLVFFTERGVGRSSGAATEERPVAVWTVRDGMAVGFEAFGDREQTLSRLGLPPR